MGYKLARRWHSLEELFAEVAEMTPGIARVINCFDTSVLCFEVVLELFVAV